MDWATSATERIAQLVSKIYAAASAPGWRPGRRGIKAIRTRMLVDLAKRRFAGLLAIGAGPDPVIWDRAHQRFVVPCGRSGTVSIINLVHGRAVPASPVATEVSARSAALDPASGEIYLPAARFGPAAPGARPSPLSGAFHVLVLAPGSHG